MRGAAAISTYPRPSDLVYLLVVIQVVQTEARGRLESVVEPQLGNVRDGVHEGVIGVAIWGLWERLHGAF